MPEDRDEVDVAVPSTVEGPVPAVDEVPPEDRGLPTGLEPLYHDLDVAIARVVAKTMALFPGKAYPRTALLCARNLVDQWLGHVAWGGQPGGGFESPWDRSTRRAMAWKQAVVTVRGNAPSPGPEPGSPKPLAEEIATYRACLPELLASEGEFALIKGRQVVGVFPERRLAQRAGYERFGVVPFLVKRIEQAEPVAYVPNVVP